MDFEESLKYDIRLLRSSPAVPQQVKLYGFFYEISSGKLTEVLASSCGRREETHAKSPLEGTLRRSRNPQLFTTESFHFANA
jgi:hypothetical protein